MLNDYTVNIVYKNRSMENVSQKSYPLIDYCQEQKLNLMHVITDVENAFYALQNDKSKDEWDAETMEAFQRIRHRLLDAANSIVRLPQNLQFKGINVGTIEGSEYIANLVNQYSKQW